MQPENAIAMSAHGLRIKGDALGLDRCGKRVNVLARSNPERQRVAPRSIQAFGTVILAQEQADRAGLEGNRDQLAVTLVAPVDGKAEDGGVPGLSLIHISEPTRLLS